jgi:hypothetical protein
MLNFLRRLLSLMAVVILMVGVTALLAAPQLVARLAESLQNTPANTRTILILAAVVIDLLLAAVAVRILRPPQKTELLVHARGARARVSLDSVQRQINTRIAQVSDVLHVHTDVEVNNGGARVELNIRTRPDIVIPEKQKEIARVLRQLVEKQMGLRMIGEPVIHLALATDEYDTTDHVTAVMEPAAEPPYVAIPASAYSEVVEVPSRAARALPQPAAQPQTEPVAPLSAAPLSGAPTAAGEALASVGTADEEGAAPELEEPEPWRAFLLEDDGKI